VKQNNPGTTLVSEMRALQAAKLIRKNSGLGDLGGLGGFHFE
jgi:hypothetical protein